MQELFTDPAQLMTGGIGQGGGFDMFQQQQQMGYNVNQSVNSSGQQGYAPQQSVGMLGGGGVIPVTALTNLGVAAEAVGQISELKNYLSRQVLHYHNIYTSLHCHESATSGLEYYRS